MFTVHVCAKTIELRWEICIKCPSENFQKTFSGDKFQLKFLTKCSSEMKQASSFSGLWGFYKPERPCCPRWRASSETQGQLVEPGRSLNFSSPEFFSRPFRLFPGQTNCPWVSKDGWRGPGSPRMGEGALGLRGWVKGPWVSEDGW